MGTKEKPVLSKSPEIHLLDEAGKILSKRAYVMGANSEILGVSSGVSGADKTEVILASGYVENEVGKKTGWIMKTTADASLIWQQTFSRYIIGDDFQCLIKHGTFVCISRNDTHSRFHSAMTCADSFAFLLL